MTWKKPTPDDLAADWIAERKPGADKDAHGHFAQFLLGQFPEDEPELTWDTIILVMKNYPEVDYYAHQKTEAQKVCGELAAGPIEDLLSYHGPQYIQKFEDLASGDRRMAWLLGGTWQFQMSDEIWQRVQLAADNSYWTRSTGKSDYSALE